MRKGAGVMFTDKVRGVTCTIGIGTNFELKDEHFANPQETLKRIMKEFDYDFINPKLFDIYCFFLWKNNYNDWIDYRTLV